ncbi:MAG: hypothetical protein AAFV80_01895 [Bacteroidota bacterium]
MPIKDEFPPAGDDYLDGNSNGLVYETQFSGSSYQKCYEMLINFLEEEGYGDLPIPKDAKELRRFRHPSRKGQIRIFEENGYLHFPIKIIFPKKPKRRNTLLLQIFNETAPDQLLRFHGLMNEIEATTKAVE